MHESSIIRMRWFVTNFLGSDTHYDVLDVGSYNVNSLVNYRKLIGNCNYLGIDLIEGPGVDLVLKGENINKLNKKFDIIISAECFEHAENWKYIFSVFCTYSFFLQFFKK